MNIINGDNIDSTSLANEINYMMNSRQKFSVEFIEAFIYKGNKLWVVMEFMDKGCLTDILEQFANVQLLNLKLLTCLYAH